MDAVLFAGETDMLELRIRTLEHVVDQFVVVACTMTHQGQPADMDRITASFNKAAAATGMLAGRRATLHWVEPGRVLVRKGIRYERSADDRAPAGSLFFGHLENQHRDGVLDAVKTIVSDPDAIVAVSDVDEIPDPRILLPLSNWPRVGEWRAAWLCCEQRFHSTALNLLHPYQPWYGTAICRLAACQPQAQRVARTTIGSPQQSVVLVPNGGWHMSWFGSDEERQRKLDTFMHSELSYLDLPALRRLKEHSNGEPLTALTTNDSLTLDWPAPLLDGTFEVPSSWLTSDAWESTR